MQSDKVNLVFKVKAPSVRHGETVHILGNGALGNWSKSDSIQLVTTPTSFPFWVTDRPIMFHVGSDVRYRYAIFRGGRFTSFENGDGDRMINIGSLEANKNGHITLDDEFGNYKEASDNILSLQVGHGLSTQVLPASLEDVEEMTRRCLYLVAYHLPVNISWTWKMVGESDSSNDASSSGINKKMWKRHWDISWNTDNISSKTEDTIANDHDTIWIGAITSNNIIPSPASASPDAVKMGAFELLQSMDEDDRQSLRTALRSIDCIPIFLEEDTTRKGYYGFCKRVAWPVFHNLSWDLESDWNQSAQGDYSEVWRSYQTINAVFAAVVCGQIKEGDCIWVHDYHLALLPECIRQRSPAAIRSTARIIMFWHVPFPTSELFRTLPTRVEIIHGILNSDVVGFHSFDHARHFLTVCQRLCGLSHQSNRGKLGVNANGRNVMISVSHVGVERKLLNSAAQSETVKRILNGMNAKLGFQRRIIFVCYEELQRLNGITLALLAFERLLGEHPRYCRRLRFLLRCMPSSSRSADCEQALMEAKELVARIQKNHGLEVIDFEIKPKYSVLERCALWLASDIMIKSCVQEGLNLSPLEYIYVKSLADSRAPNDINGGGDKARSSRERMMSAKTSPQGVVLVSEFCSSARILNGAVRINPWDIVSVAKTLEQAIKMSPEEGRQRRERDFGHISSQTSSAWTRRVVADAYSSRDVELAAIDHDKSYPAGTIVSSNMRHLPLKDVTQSYLKCREANRHRVFIFDYGGTLISRESTLQSIKYDFMGITRRTPSSRVVDALRKLCSDPYNHVFVISSAENNLLERVFPLEKLPQLGLVARAGLFYSWINRPKSNDSLYDSLASSIGRTTLRPSGRALSVDTEVISSNSRRIEIEPFAPPSLVLDRNAKLPHDKGVTDKGDAKSQQHMPSGRTWVQPWSNTQGDDWESVAMPILQNYTWRTGGSKIRRSATQLGWSFRQADPQLGKKNAVFLQQELEVVLARFPVTVKQAHDSVNIVPKGIHKGVAVNTVMEEVGRQIGGTFPGFVLCVGDDAADEPMFSTLLELVGRNKDQVDSTKLYTCSIGRKPSQAEFYFNATQDLESFLCQISQCEN